MKAAEFPRVSKAPLLIFAVSEPLVPIDVADSVVPSGKEAPPDADVAPGRQKRLQGQQAI